MPDPRPATTYTVPVPRHKAGTRLDRFLAEAVPALSRTRLKGLIEAGRVRIEAGPQLREASYRVKSGEVLAVVVPPPQPARPEAQAMDLEVVFEDAHLIIVDKPAGLVVHPAPGHADGTLVNGLLAHCRDSLSGIGGVSRPGIVHRLDKDTSGLLAAAKTDAAHHALAEQFAAHTIERAYQAVVWGVPRRRRGEISGNIGRSRANRKKMAVLAAGGKPALTRYRVVRPLGRQAALMECRLATGRTHQIRVHMADLGHPIVGDPVYGGRRRGAQAAARAGAFGRQALHAHILGFVHPATRTTLRFCSRLPCDIKALIEYLEAL